ncbi:MAG TPA: roadblock/LC7 domain-containing protein [Candidatus Nanopelagicaceae bacterium]|nr:roadblock/LC7 domain-containing protein [Candidatus Nanopelagicaceae bacterium]
MSDLTQDQASSLSKFLGNITEHTELEALALVTNDGLRLAFSCIPDYDVDPDLFSSLSAVVMQSGHDAIDSLGYVNLLEVVLRGINAFIILSGAGRFFLMGASRKIEDLGKIVTVFRYYAGEIGRRYPTQ